MNSIKGIFAKSKRVWKQMKDIRGISAKSKQVLQEISQNPGGDLSEQFTQVSKTLSGKERQHLKRKREQKEMRMRKKQKQEKQEKEKKAAEERKRNRRIESNRQKNQYIQEKICGICNKLRRPFKHG